MRSTSLEDGDHYAQPKRTSRPTVIPPGQDKVQVLADRHASGQSLWHRGDYQENERRSTIVYQETFGERLHRLRILACFSIRKFAEQSGLSRQAIYYFERGQRRPRLNTLQRLARALKISISALVGDPSTATPVFMQTCSRCGASKPNDSFSPRSNTPSGLSYNCRACERERTNRKNYPRKRKGAPTE